MLNILWEIRGFPYNVSLQRSSFWGMLLYQEQALLKRFFLFGWHHKSLLLFTSYPLTAWLCNTQTFVSDVISATVFGLFPVPKLLFLKWRLIYPVLYAQKTNCILRNCLHFCSLLFTRIITIIYVDYCSIMLQGLKCLEAALWNLIHCKRP